MELLALSKFKLQLLALISQSRDLHDSDRRLRDELTLTLQRHRQTEAALEQSLRELHAEIASRDEAQRKLQTKVRCLESDNCLLEKKEKESRGTIDGLLQSRDAFIAHYEDSTHSLKCSVEMRDRKLAVLSEKLNDHLMLFSAIEKEAASVKHLVGNVQHAMCVKEQVVSELRGKMRAISTLEKDFVEKIQLLENKITGYKSELQRKDATIFELKEQFKVEKVNSNSQPQIDQLREALLVKEEVVQKLTLEKQALHFELHNLELTVQKIQDAVTKMTSEDQKAMSSVFGDQECEMTTVDEHDNSDNQIAVTEGDLSDEKSDELDTIHAAMTFHQNQMSGSDPSSENHSINTDLPKSPICHPQSECSDPLSTNVPHIPADVNMDTGSPLAHHVGFESSTSGVETLEAAPL